MELRCPKTAVVSRDWRRDEVAFMGLNDELLTILLIFLFWFYSTSFLISFMCGPGGRLVEGPFSIDATSGIVTLVAPLDKSRLSYQLNLCCTPFVSSCSCSCFLVTVVVMSLLFLLLSYSK